jgi:hypothetical protein
MVTLFTMLIIPLLRLGIFVQHIHFFGGLFHRGVPDGFSAPNSHAAQTLVVTNHKKASAEALEMVFL